MDYTKVIIKPLISEKAAEMHEAGNQVVFYVHPEANKIEIAKAVEKAFDVKVTGVNVVRRRPRVRSRFGRRVGTESGHKKAYVTLAEGHKIELFEGV
ncbi:50S ribosomal protein L23 [Desulfobaculum senezii]|jgi:large subunit ribosomal protein L23|uniref:50S ribosomal protein L23 n=1 Tax=Desulfobaculum sp. SPO524 TaxID=3378071 RepID=UPI003853DD39